MNTTNQDPTTHHRTCSTKLGHHSQKPSWRWADKMIPLWCSQCIQLNAICGGIGYAKTLAAVAIGLKSVTGWWTKGDTETHRVVVSGIMNKWGGAIGLIQNEPGHRSAWGSAVWIHVRKAGEEDAHHCGACPQGQAKAIQQVNVQTTRGDLCGGSHALFFWVALTKSTAIVLI